MHLCGQPVGHVSAETADSDSVVLRSVAAHIHQQPQQHPKKIFNLE